MDSKKQIALDVRVRARNLRSGTITEAEVKQHLANLPDVAQQSELMQAEQPGFPHDVQEDSDDPGDGTQPE